MIFAMKLNVKKIIKRLVFLLIFGGAAAYGAWYGWQKWKMHKQELQAKDEKSPDKLFSAKRGDLVIGITLSGSVNTKIKHKLALGVPLSTKLVAVVDENAQVEKGDIVARFETENLQTQIDDLKLSIADGEKTLELALEELEILKSTNAADIKTAQDNLDDAISAYSKLRKLEGPKSKNAQDQSVSDASQKLKDAEEKYKTAYENYYNPTDVADDEAEEASRKSAYESALKTLKSARISYRNAVLDRKIFKRYTQPNNYKNAKDKVKRLELTLKKELVRTQSNLAQKNTSIANARVNLRKKLYDLEQALYNMTRMQLVAPVSGFVTYGDTERRRWGNLEVKVGMDVYRRQVLATIPDMSKTVIDVDIPEQYRSKVRTGADVIITPDSVENLKIPGKLTVIAPLPILLIPWDPNSAKAYKSTIEFHTDDPRVVSGINVRVEIVSQILKNVVYVPAEAIFEKEGRYFVYKDTLSGPVEADVEIGLSNDNYVEIKNGIAENDIVYLYRPFQQDKTE